MTSSDLKAWRESLGMSQRAAAARLGVKLKAYQEWERGLRFGTEKPVLIDRRTELACLAISAKLDKE